LRRRSAVIGAYMAVPGSVVGQTVKFYAIFGVGFMDAEDSQLELAVRFGERSCLDA
jgi:hypothetical protein